MASTEYAPHNKIERQDSGFVAGTPTPVTPSRYDIPHPSYNPLPPIPEATTNSTMESVASHRRADSYSIEPRCRPQEQTSSIRPSRPTTLSPHAPPPMVIREDDMTPMTPGTILRNYHHNPKQFEHYLSKTVEEILEKVVPETPQEDETLQLCQQPVEDDHETLTFSLQRVVYPISDKDLTPNNKDGCYYEYRDYDRVEDMFLGCGGFGQVYACCDRNQDTMFAIKCNKQTDKDKIDVMMEECKILDQIGENSYITQFMGALIDEGVKFKMLMECATNGNLNELLVDPETNERLGLPLDQSLYYLQQILSGVDYLHQRSILHLDLKCANVLVFNEGRHVKLTDFGSSVKLSETSIKLQEGFTVHFAAPEVIKTGSASFSADIWSAMCCLIEMITGYLPWCFSQPLEYTSIVFIVGRYDDQNEDNFKLLVPYADLELNDETIHLFKLVFRNEPSSRPTARDLLNNPLIVEAQDYEKYFDGCEGYDEEEEAPLPPINEEASACEANKLAGRGSVDSGNEVSPDSILSEESPPTIDYSRNDSGVSVSERSLRLHFMNMTISNDSTSAAPPPFSSNRTITHSCSAPSDTRGGCWDDNSIMFDDIEKDGPPMRRVKVLKRTTSANYVSNGPEADSPDGKRTTRNIPNALLPLGGGGISRGSMVSVGTQTTNLSPTVESKAHISDQMIVCYSQPLR